MQPDPKELCQICGQTYEDHIKQSPSPFIFCSIPGTECFEPSGWFDTTSSLQGTQPTPNDKARPERRHSMTTPKEVYEGLEQVENSLQGIIGDLKVEDVPALMAPIYMLATGQLALLRMTRKTLERLDKLERKYNAPGARN